MKIRLLMRALSLAAPMVAAAAGLRAQGGDPLPPAEKSDELVSHYVETQIGNDVAGEYNDVGMDMRMQQVVSGLVGPSTLRAPQPRFRILDSPVPNVFGVPYRTLYVTRGMLQQLRGDDELAVVLAHALGHDIAGHDHWDASLRARLAAVRVSDALLGPGFAAAMEEPLAGRSAGLRFLLRSYTPAEERQADSIAARLLAGSPYSARAGAGVLDVLSREAEWAGALFPAFARTHPGSGGRAALLASATPPPGGAPRALRMAEPLDSSLVGQVVGERGFLGFVAAGAYYRIRDRTRIGLPPAWTARMLGGYLSATSPAGHAVVVLRAASNEGAEALATEYRYAGSVPRISPLVFEINGRPVFWWQDAQPGGGTRIVAFYETTGVGWQITGVADAAGVQELQQAVQWMIRDARPLAPGETPTQPRLVLVTVPRTATLRELVAPFARGDVSVAEIARLNRLDPAAMVPAGTRLRIPVIDLAR